MAEITFEKKVRIEIKIVHWYVNVPTLNQTVKEV